MKLLLPILLIVLLSNCANMVAPTGGNKDENPPKLLQKEMEILQENKRVITFQFDELIQMNNWEDNFYISPPIKKTAQKKIKATKIQIVLDDSLKENTTYNIVLNKCIKDINEGNILDSLHFVFSSTNVLDTLTLRGNLLDAFSTKPIENAWIMLFDEHSNDSVIFKEFPNYIAKTDQKGNFYFPNLNTNRFKMVALTGFDFIYNEEEKIAFLDTIIDANSAHFISLFAFNPISADSLNSIQPDSIVDDSLSTSSVEQNEQLYGQLEIIGRNIAPCIFQLLQNNVVVKEFTYQTPPFILYDLIAGKYQLKYIKDTNQDKKWTTGSWKERKQPEKTKNYPTEITIRSNWDLKIDWNLE